MAPTMNYIAAVAFLVSSITATPLNIVKKTLAEWDDSSIIEDLANNQEGSFIPNAKIDWNAPSIDHRDVANLTALGLHKRQDVDCNNRPDGVSNIAICGPRFVNMGTRDDDKWGPALEAMPQFNHARLNGVERSCYPESGANAANDGINPGLRSSLGAGVAVGTDCADPNDSQPYSGPLMRAKSFPVYVDGVYCSGDESWRIVYNLYYPKDYNHRHDWERAIVVFKKDGSGQDWWNRSNLFLGQHSGYNKLPWSSATAHDDPYASSGNRGSEGAHPRVFPGLYHHAIFNEAKTGCLGPGCAPSQEYRRNNWQYTPVLGDVQQGVVAIPEAWGDYNGKTTPSKAIGSVCGI